MSDGQPFTPPCPLHTAVLFLIYKRPDTTRQVFEAIRQAKPPRLYVAADGPKANVPGEAEKVQQARDIVINGVDWDCEVKTLFRETNLGCKYGVSGGITWFFEHEEEGIILEDDTLPSQSFFWFCQELLERYRDDERIFIISGYNKQNEWLNGKFDYFFSFFGGIWGWATWRRAWKHYDMEMTDIEQYAENGFFEQLLGKKLGIIRKKQLLNAKIQNINGKMNTWAFPWAFTRHLHNGLACVPSLSLIINIGFSENATHTRGNNIDNVCRNNILFPLKYNDNFVADELYDIRFLGHANIAYRIMIQIKSLLKL
ncbi:hypothetical protein [Desulfonatronum thioautotrophicum]|uniref:hypothetical protein n=1 Tax=Desulfonatronum thioautotrophicum TaxID=617001 RepID=UPI0005EBA62C|nr:hypothetical protein [Desulfonatronum thioautotrophicum]